MSEEELAQVDVFRTRSQLVINSIAAAATTGTDVRQFVIALEQAGERKYGFNPSALVKTANESS